MNQTLDGAIETVEIAKDGHIIYFDLSELKGWSDDDLGTFGHPDP